MDDITGTVINKVGFDVLRNDHRNRIMAYCSAKNVNALQLLGLYWHMASKPDGWQFNYKRLAREIPGIGENAIGALLRHLTALGYYKVAQHRGEDGRTTRTATFDAGNTWPAQSDATQSDPPITETNARLPRLGPPRLGGPRISVNTEEVSTDNQSSHERPAENADSAAAGDDLIDESSSDEKKSSIIKSGSSSIKDERQFLADLEPITGLSFQAHKRSLAAARHAIEGGYTPGTALDAIADQGHDLKAAGAGLILQLVEQLPIRIKRDPWRDNLPAECGHPEAAQVDYNPAHCLQCRAEAGDPYAVKTMVERLAAAKRIPA